MNRDTSKLIQKHMQELEEIYINLNKTFNEKFYNLYLNEEEEKEKKDEIKLIDSELKSREEKYIKLRDSHYSGDMYGNKDDSKYRYLLAQEKQNLENETDLLTEIINLTKIKESMISELSSIIEKKNIINKEIDFIKENLQNIANYSTCNKSSSSSNSSSSTKYVEQTEEIQQLTKQSTSHMPTQQQDSYIKKRAKKKKKITN